MNLKRYIPSFLISAYHFFWALFACLVYSYPSKKIKVIGITGTNGKSTTASLTAKILEEAGLKVASLNSIKFKIGTDEKENDLKMTMPGRLVIQKFLREAVSKACDVAIIEVTSEGIKQHRHRFIDFDVAVLTNLSPEHIESHGGFENYKSAKLKLFKAAKKLHIINFDDKYANFFLQAYSKQKIIYSIRTLNEDFDSVKAEQVNVLPEGSTFKIDNIDFKISLLGEFNVYNALAAISVAKYFNIGLDVCSNALREAVGVQGRMEEVIQYPFKVFVDYAFTPNALEQVYKFLKPKQKKMIALLGACGGGRDKWKRPVLGKIAAKYADKIILADEDPYDEDPLEILKMIEEGIFEHGFKKDDFFEILDRKEAIKKALQLADPGDVVIITGKGCEPWMCLAKGKKIEWDEKRTILEEFKNLDNQHLR